MLEPCSMEGINIPSSDQWWLEGGEYDAYSAVVSYAMIRGWTSQWPIRTIGADCFLYRLRKKTAIMSFDLPSEAQWEYACRAGTTSRDIYGFSNDGGSDYKIKLDRLLADVGNWLPNAWGLYGFLKGSYSEFVGDKWSWNLGIDPVIDPVGPLYSGDPIVVRGLGSGEPHKRIQASYFEYYMAHPITFRVAVHLD